LTEPGQGGETNDALEIARRGFERFNAGDWEGFLETAHPAIVMTTDPIWPGGGRYVGVDAFERFLSQFLEAFSSVRWQDERKPEAIGEFALFRGRWVGAGASTGIETESPPFSVVFGARAGKTVEARFFFDDREARAYLASSA
jgi:hypothetical protein